MVRGILDVGGDGRPGAWATLFDSYTDIYLVYKENQSLGRGIRNRFIEADEAGLVGGRRAGTLRCEKLQRNTEITPGSLCSRVKAWLAVLPTLWFQEIALYPSNKIPSLAPESSLSQVP